MRVKAKRRSHSTSDSSDSEHTDSDTDDTTDDDDPDIVSRFVGGRGAFAGIDARSRAQPFAEGYSRTSSRARSPSACPTPSSRGTSASWAIRRAT